MGRGEGEGLMGGEGQRDLWGRGRERGKGFRGEGEVTGGHLQFPSLYLALVRGFTLGDGP